MKTSVVDRIADAPRRREASAELAQHLKAGQALTSAVINSLSGAIRSEYETRRRGPKPRWHYYVDGLAWDWVALAVLSSFTQPWLQKEDDKGPAVTSVVKKIGFALGASEANLRPVGNALLAIAEQAGIVELRAESLPGKRMDAIRVYPSESTRRELDVIYAKLLSYPELYPQPTDTCPEPDIEIRPNKTGRIAPAEPVGDDVSEALRIVQGTQWRVNHWLFIAALTYFKSNDPNMVPADVVAVLASAGKWATADKFFYRHTFDWRGRMYQHGGALQWTAGGDLARGMLEFTRGAPLDNSGQLQLRQYLSDLAGVKTPYERAGWIEDNKDLIEACAEKPVEQLQAWNLTEGPAGDKPFTFLAACRAWRDGLEGKPVRIPVFIDCTCSGLQHYAYMMRDIDLAKKLKLVAGYDSGDFYSMVAESVSTAIGYDVDRSKAKPGVMHTFYGISARTIGIALGEKAPYALAKKIQAEAWKMAGTPAKALYDWLRRVERRFTCRGAVIPGTPRRWTDSLPFHWTAPSGFRVEHDERVQRALTLEIPQPGRTRSGKPRKRTYTEGRSEKIIDAAAQRRGVAPNFIHSMDAALLVETVRQGYLMGIHDWTLAHDAFGTHPNLGSRLYEAPRRAAQEIYGRDVLSDIAAEFERQGASDLPPVPDHPSEFPAAISRGPASL